MRMLWLWRAMRTMQKINLTLNLDILLHFEHYILFPWPFFFFFCDNSYIAVGLSACPQLKNFLLGWGRECWLVSWATTSFSGELLYVILRNCYCEFIIGIELRYYSKTLVNIYCIFKLLYVVTEFTLMYKIFLHLVGRSNDINLTCFW